VSAAAIMMALSLSDLLSSNQIYLLIVCIVFRPPGTGKVSAYILHAHIIFSDVILTPNCFQFFVDYHTLRSSQCAPYPSNESLFW
jgi:hypothetical protein